MKYKVFTDICRAYMYSSTNDYRVNRSGATTQVKKCNIARHLAAWLVLFFPDYSPFCLLDWPYPNYSRSNFGKHYKIKTLSIFENFI